MWTSDDEADCPPRKIPRQTFSRWLSWLRVWRLWSKNQNSSCNTTYQKLNQEGDSHELTDLLAEDGEMTFTVEEAVEAIGLGFFQIRLYFLTGMFSVSDALEMMLLAVLSPVLMCEWHLHQWQVALISTVVFVGMLIMAPLWGMSGDLYGRKITLFIVAVWIGYYGILTSLSPTFIWVLILRGLVGAGLAGSPQAFTLLAEYLPAKQRARLLVFHQIFWAGGACFELFMAYLVIPAYGWRWLVGLSSLPILCCLIIINLMPESSRFLMAAGREDEATQVLECAAQLNKTVTPKGRLVMSSAYPRGNFRDLLSPNYLRTSLQMWLIWCGTASIYFGMLLASPQILSQNHNSGCSSSSSLGFRTDENKCSCHVIGKDDYFGMLLSTVGEFFALPINIFLIEHIGRRKTGTFNFVGAGIFFVLTQLCVSKRILTLFIFAVRGFSSSCFNFAYIYTAEVYPTTVRTLGIGMCSAWARLGAMVTPFIAQVLLEYSLQLAVWMYGAICLVCALTCMLLPIETKGRHLPQSVKE